MNVAAADGPGTSAILRPVNLRNWMVTLNEMVDVIPIGICLLDNCPYKDAIIQKVKAGVEVVEGTHCCRPEKVFGQ